MPVIAVQSALALTEPQPYTNLTYTGDQQYLVSEGKGDTENEKFYFWNEYRTPASWDTDRPAEQLPGTYTVRFVLAKPSDIEKIKSQKFFNLLKELDILELAVLKVLPTNRSYPKHVTSIYNECVPKFNGLTKEDVSMQLETLMANGLVAQISSQEMANRRQIGGNRRPLRDQPLYYKTILGTKFLQFIDKE